MNILIVKLGATGDVVRTTSLLRRLTGRIIWLASAKNTVLLENLRDDLQCLSWEQRHLVPDIRFDLIINLEDTLEIALYLKTLQFTQLFGAYADSENQMCYSADSRRWFDMSLISVHGRKEADRRKLLNRQSYQDLIFGGLGFRFEGETYLLPQPIQTGLTGDIAIAHEAGPVWPMKRWAYYDTLKRELEADGLTVNMLPQRASLLEHLADVKNHRLLVSGDTLPMHFGIGIGIPCVSLFTCTSPWEIHGYGIQRKIMSPLLEEFFYHRGFDERATTAISVEEVLVAIWSQLDPAVRVRLSAGK